MGGGSGKRRRSIVLTPQGRGLLEAALVERWQHSGGGRKLTREERAHLLGLSIATCERLLRGDGVDRTTVLLAFRSLGLEFREAYIGLPEDTVEQSPATSPMPPSAEAPADQVGRRTGHRRWLAVAFTGAIAVAWFSMGRMALRATEPEIHWKVVTSSAIREGTEAYHAARYEVAEGRLSFALAVAREHHSPGHLAEALRMLADVAMARGDFDTAVRRYREALFLRQTFKQPVTEPPIREALASAEAKRGNLTEAEQQLRLALQGFEVQQDENGVAQAKRTLGTVKARQGDAKAALELYEEALAIARRRRAKDLESDILGRVALLLRDQGRLHEAKSLLQASLDHWSRSGHPRWIATMKMHLASVELAAGAKGQAAELLRASLTAFANLGDAANVQECEELLGRCDELREDGQSG